MIAAPANKYRGENQKSDPVQTEFKGLFEKQHSKVLRRVDCGAIDPGSTTYQLGEHTHVHRILLASVSSSTTENITFLMELLGGAKELIVKCLQQCLPHRKRCRRVYLNTDKYIK